MGERLNGIQEVGSSILPSSTRKYGDFARSPLFLSPKPVEHSSNRLFRLQPRAKPLPSRPSHHNRCQTAEDGGLFPSALRKYAFLSSIQAQALPALPLVAASEVSPQHIFRLQCIALKPCGLSSRGKNAAFSSPLTGRRCAAPCVLPFLPASALPRSAHGPADSVQKLSVQLVIPSKHAKTTRDPGGFLFRA